MTLSTLENIQESSESGRASRVQQFQQIFLVSFAGDFHTKETESQTIFLFKKPKSLGKN